MKETKVHTTCDMCLSSQRVEGFDPYLRPETTWFWIQDLDICPRCALAIQKAHSLGKTERIAQEVEELVGEFEYSAEKS